jgi:hypothetical protein
MTKQQRKLLHDVNKERHRNGESPLESLRTPKLDKKNFRSGNSLPDYTWNPRGTSTAHIPSKIHDMPADAYSTGRNTVMDKVQRGEITGKDASILVMLTQQKTQVRKYEKLSRTITRHNGQRVR